jgi:hypothetical protein
MIATEGVPQMKKRGREIVIMGGGPVGDPDMANANHLVVSGVLFLLWAGIKLLNSQPN